MKIDYTPHAAQMEIHKARDARFRTVCTGRRFGKTLCMAAEILVHEGTPESVVVLTRWDVAPVFEEAPDDQLFVRARAQHLKTLRPEIS